MLNLDGVASMEASIMSGDDLNAGCVTLIEDILHPITVARRVMENTNHTFLGADGAMRFAKEQNIEILDPKGQLVTQHAKDALEAFKRDKAKGICTVNAKTEIGHVDEVENVGDVGTVGAVAIDSNGNIAVATSTGGMTGKIVGRIGDTPLLGSGTYADNNAGKIEKFVNNSGPSQKSVSHFKQGGVSTTGHGETIMRYNVAQKILQRIEYLNEDAQTATRNVLEKMTERLTHTAGAITIDANGNVGHYFTAKKMAWAYRKANQVYYGIRIGDNFVEPA